MLNISVENQRAFDERWPFFEKVPAKHKGFNVAPLIGPVDLSPALATGQIEHVAVSGEAFDSRRPCMHEWMVAISEACERYRVNLAINLTGNVYIKDGHAYETRSFDRQVRNAYDLGLSRHFNDVEYKLRSAYDKHILTKDEMVRRVYNSDRCARCTNVRYCTGCAQCMKCKDVQFVSLEDILRMQSRYSTVCQLQCLIGVSRGYYRRIVRNTDNDCLISNNNLNNHITMAYFHKECTSYDENRNNRRDRIHRR